MEFYARSFNMPKGYDRNTREKRHSIWIDINVRTGRSCVGGRHKGCAV
jgi:hypothetical protein